MSAAHADGSDVEVTPLVGYRFGGTFDIADSFDSYELDDAASYGLLVNFRHGQNTQWEILYSRQRSDAVYSDAAADVLNADIDMHTLQLGGTYFGEGNLARPYVALTIGGTYVETNARGSESDAFFSGSLGLGLRVRPRERLGFRLEARAHTVLMNSSTDLFCRTGPDLNVCALEIEGEFFYQLEMFAGVVFRF